MQKLFRPAFLVATLAGVATLAAFTVTITPPTLAPENPSAAGDIKAVSYTHLDVYKRQALMRAVGFVGTEHVSVYIQLVQIGPVVRGVRHAIDHEPGIYLPHPLRYFVDGIEGTNNVGTLRDSYQYCFGVQQFFQIAQF